jgi:hypothetical protein
MPLLISDANILIDMEAGDLQELMFRLPHEFAVPDLLFEDELSEQHTHLLGLGLRTMALNADVVRRAVELAAKYRRPSRYDLMALALAESAGCPLLTGDEALRKAAEAEIAIRTTQAQPAIEVRGTLWLVEELVRTRLISVSEARQGYARMKAQGRRLPWSVAEQRLKPWEQ